MTAVEARNQAIADGYVGEPTPEILRLYGWTPDDPLADVVLTGAVRSPEQLRDDLALLLEEGKQYNIPAQVWDKVKVIVAGAFALV